MAKLPFSLAEVKLLAHALNSCRITSFSSEQLECLPKIGQKMSAYIVESSSKKPGPKKQLNSKQEVELASALGLSN